MAGQESVARIRMLDDTIHSYDIKVKCYGNVLYQMVLKDLQVLEADFFGIQYPDKDGAMVFLEPMKRIKKQIENINNVVMQFVVKFFPPDPGQLQEEYTRYLFALQVKQDLIKSMLPCNESTMVMMSSYVVQSDFGDWDSVACGDLSYLKDFPIMNGEWASPDIFKKVADQHKAQIGQTPADADFHLLDIVRRLDHYGLRLHSAKDQENASINLAVAHMGVIVFRGNAKINTFNWARIRKLSFKKKRFLVKLRIAEQTSEGVNSTVGDVLVFVMPSRDICKSFWRLCIEYHAFFRLDVHPQPKPQALLIKRGSTFRYTGKTQKELHELVRHSNFQRSAFTRASSRKQTSSSYKSSPQPLNLPGASASKKTYEDPRYNSGDFVPSPIKATSEVNGRAFASPDVGEKSPSFSETNYNENSSVAAEQNAVEQNWRVESKNLHSNSGKVNQSEVEQETFEVQQKEDSPLHLHSSGLPPNSGLGTSSTLSSNGTPAFPIASPSAVLSTRGLKSTSSLAMDMKQQTASEDYFMFKEILTTERAYVKDLEVINSAFKAAMQKDSEMLLPENVANQLFGGMGSLLVIHQQFLSSLEEQSSLWEGPGIDSQAKQSIDDILLSHMQMLKKYLESLENGETLITALEEVSSRDPKFESTYRDFELQKVCYLPFNSFLLKPMQRVVQYKVVFGSLLAFYQKYDPEPHASLAEAFQESCVLVKATQERLKRAHNIQKVAQLKRDLIGVDNLVVPGRTFIREGSLYKLSRKGFQQRLFFLFSDCLLYTSKGVTSTNQFKVHAELPLQGMIIEINEGESVVPNCFSILSGNKTVIVAAATQEEMNKWLEDFSVAIGKCTNENYKFESPLTLGSRASLSRLSMEQSSEDGDNLSRTSMEKLHSQQRSNATMHVCWHRNTSVSSTDHLVSLKNPLSGYLLRKFKNSNGWQKLWVVFTNFCLFFYKSHQDDSPLASLPLLGYTVNSPSEQDKINKDFVFKLQFKSHVYFFRAESAYTYNRWLQVISSATVTSQRTRLFSRMDSNLSH